MVNLNKILGPDVDFTTKFCSPNQIAARIINNILARNPLQFFYPDEYQYSSIAKLPPSSLHSDASYIIDITSV